MAVERSLRMVVDAVIMTVSEGLGSRTGTSSFFCSVEFETSIPSP
jgi:hypothetical protein